ncbi:MAG TPA: hypothetical protein VLW50_26270 [Streptosporangiaceae bacterium]|nr:hypothetical protein [Streptosporangiaceae bacterium]
MPGQARGALSVPSPRPFSLCHRASSRPGDGDHHVAKGVAVLPSEDQARLRQVLDPGFGGPVTARDLSMVLATNSRRANQVFSSWLSRGLVDESLYERARPARGPAQRLPGQLDERQEAALTPEQAREAVAAGRIAGVGATIACPNGKTPSWRYESPITDRMVRDGAAARGRRFGRTWDAGGPPPQWAA